jgi:outer membrane protein TolC
MVSKLNDIVLRGILNKEFIVNLKRFIVVLFIILSLALGTALAQDAQTFTLQQSIEYALAHSPDLAIAEKEYGKSKAAVGEAYANILPQINASADFQRAWEIQENTLPNFIKQGLGPQADPNMPDYIKLSFGLKNTFRYGAVLSQPLFLGFAGVAGIQIASAAKRASEQNVEARRQQLIYDAADAFYLCLLTRQLADVQGEALAQAKANFDVVRKKFDVGMASGFDKMRAEVEVANLQPAVISARNNHQLALTRFKMVLGMKPGSSVEVSGDFIYSADEIGKLSLAELQEQAGANRPEMMALGEQLQIAEKGVTIARSEFLPKLFFQTDYSFLAQKNNTKFSGNDFSKGFTSAVSLQFPLFSGFRSVRQYQKARLDYRIMQDTKQQADFGIAAEVEVAYSKYKEAEEKYISANETVNLAKEALRLATLMYDEGANTQLDVLNSQLALTQARMNYVSALYDYQIARYQLRKVTGNLKGAL